ncbi:hypothetical protein [Bacillus sp. JCM 19041]|uniref:hypothetical protein n=1 Tax=Bacillus sp. JCM 19041 TaxID=1460637 RepID=UPI0006CF23AE
MELSDDDVRQLFGISYTPKTDQTKLLVLDYLYLVYARQILERDLARFNKGVRGIKYSTVYAEGVQKSLLKLTADIRKAKQRLHDEKIHVHLEREPTSIPDIQHRYWHNGRTGTVGAVPFLFSQRVAKTIQLYLFPS